MGQVALAVFNGRLSLMGDANSVAANLEVGPDRVVIHAGAVLIGDWPRSEVAIASSPSGVTIQAEGENLLFASATIGFASALGLAGQPALMTRLQQAAVVRPEPHRQRRRTQPAVVLVTAALGLVIATGVTALALRGDNGSGSDLSATSGTSTPLIAPVAAPTELSAGAGTTVRSTIAGVATTTPLTTLTTATSPPTTAISAAAPSTTAVPPPTTAAPTTTAAPPTTAPPTTTAPPPTTTQPARNLASIGNGTWFIGPDIQPGTWESWGSSLTPCLWARLSGADFVMGNIIESGGGPGTGGNVSGTVKVVIQASDVAFYSSGCGSWNRL